MTVTWAHPGHAHSALNQCSFLSVCRDVFLSEVNMYFLNYRFVDKCFVFCCNLWHICTWRLIWNTLLFFNLLLLPALLLNCHLLLLSVTVEGWNARDAKSLSCFSWKQLEWMQIVSLIYLICYNVKHALCLSFSFIICFLLTEEKKANYRWPAGWKKTGDAEKAPSVSLLRPQV